MSWEIFDTYAIINMCYLFPVIFYIFYIFKVFWLLVAVCCTALKIINAESNNDSIKR